MNFDFKQVSTKEPISIRKLNSSPSSYKMNVGHYNEIEFQDQTIPLNEISKTLSLDTLNEYSYTTNENSDTLTDCQMDDLSKFTVKYRLMNF